MTVILIFKMKEKEEVLLSFMSFYNVDRFAEIGVDSIRELVIRVFKVKNQRGKRTFF